jgi:hypothetical protein
MSKQIVFLLALLLLSVACGKKSTIKTSVEAEKLSCAYGDCKHIIRNVAFPLDNSMLAFNNPLPGLGPIAGGIIKFVGDIFAKNTDMGRMEMQYVQPLPEIPSVVKSVRLKRFFFYMKPMNKKLSFRRKVTDWLSRYLLGKGHTTFKFLDKLAVRLSAVDVVDEKNYVPTLMTKLDNEEAVESLDSIFKKAKQSRVVDTEIAKEIILLKYYKKTKSLDTSSKNYGQIHYLETTQDPIALRDYFANSKELAPFLTRVMLLDKSILVELKRDPISNVTFQNFMEKYADEIESRFDVNYIDTCDENSCLEINVPDINLLPIALKGNSLKLESVLEADNVPESFKLKGFVEFELKIESDV